ncbi:unnamed protein product [Eruca vesicaria subsp. sativa]|uniref:Leucine-rich repeat-containing N-terminal plant-type domain-containing protein n=1 Tax=Eruca vesicaria subsp. sativa TaxID=29727 RepID=A0ABC8M643_ERUVS|nr:unnamed protein product [Eruca vesicaria subsp. sativa]
MRSKGKSYVRSSSTTRPIQPLSFHMLYLFLHCFLSFHFLFLTVSEAVCNPHDQETLLWFSGNVSSPVSPLKWDPSVDCCSWEGITCDDSLDSHITKISLPSRGLSGNLTSTLLNFHSLSHLDLSHNRLLGPLPPGFFSSLDQLKVLNLSYNSFRGELPLEQSFGNNGSIMFFPIETIDLSSNLLQGRIFNSSKFLQGAFNLTSFNVSNNSFTGPLPSFLCKSSSQLRKLDFSYNDFSGSISQGLGKCFRLSIIRAGFNRLSGEIPSDIYNLSNLEQLFLPFNQLSGKINDEITSLKKLTSLELYFNLLEGEIPRSIGNLSNLRSLQLHTNNLSGHVPLSLANCTNLVNLNLRVNHLRGSLTELDFTQFQILSVIDIGNNSFTGDLPEKIYSCKSLTAIRLSGNKITGQISPQILKLKSLSFLSLSDNKLTNITGALSILQGCKKLSTLLVALNFYNETFPSNKDLISPHGFPKLKIFGLGGCGLKGVIPSWLININSLEVLDLSVNQLVGSIPGWLGTLPNLFYLELSDNQLSGQLSKDIFQLKALMSQKADDDTDRKSLELPVYVSPSNVTKYKQQYNQMSSLPSSIYISRNHLTGSIPVEVGKLKAIQNLDLSFNYLSGGIPDELSNLTRLERLDLSNNNLSGRIPWSLRRLHFMSYFSVAYNNFEGQVPTGGQFDTFMKSYYEGNALLCGGILLKPCTIPTQPPSASANQDEEELSRTIFLGLGIGYFFGFTSFLVVRACSADVI